MCPACTNVWVRDLGNYRFPVEKIGECPTQCGRKPLCLKRKREVYDKCVLPVLTYGSETWAITNTLLRKLVSAQNSRKRNILNTLLRKLVSAQHSMERNLSSLLEAEGIRQMCPACTNVWARDLGNYRYPVEKIGECPTQFGKKPLCLKRKDIPYAKSAGLYLQQMETLEQTMPVHPQFVGYDTDRLVSLSTGIVADTSVNCDNAVELGLKAASEMAGKKFTEIKLCRNDKVETIGAQNKTIKVRGRNMEVNPTIIFNRITCGFNSSSEMELLNSELS
ncbi:hypothetical protein GQR58_001388 [Nymphon striatum]|nr:hypothetical protein GQR58_001388 [Nymphon striatum]